MATQSIIHGGINAMSASTKGMLDTIATKIFSITNSTASSVNAVLMGVKILMVKEIGNIANTIECMESGHLGASPPRWTQSPMVHSNSSPTK